MVIDNGLLITKNMNKFVYWSYDNMIKLINAYYKKGVVFFNIASLTSPCNIFIFVFFDDISIALMQGDEVLEFKKYNNNTEYTEQIEKWIDFI